MISFKWLLKSLSFISKNAYPSYFINENFMISIFLTKKLKNDFTKKLNNSKSSDYIPYLIISFFHSIYDQFQMITENFDFYLEKCLSYIFHI